jgi:hypothetical protein
MSSPDLNDLKLDLEMEQTNQKRLINKYAKRVDEYREKGMMYSIYIKMPDLRELYDAWLKSGDRVAELKAQIKVKKHSSKQTKKAKHSKSHSSRHSKSRTPTPLHQVTMVSPPKGHSHGVTMVSPPPEGHNYHGMTAHVNIPKNNHVSHHEAPGNTSLSRSERSPSRSGSTQYSTSSRASAFAVTLPSRAQKARRATRRARRPL